MARGGARPGAGRKPGVPNKVTANIKSLAGVYGQEAVATLAEIMKDPAHPPAARVAAAKELIDRGFGKATQPIAGDPDLPPVALTPTTIHLVAPGDDG
ncbi:hypothetical protein MyNCGM121_41710 [Achromobacter xylosoxidans]